MNVLATVIIAADPQLNVPLMNDTLLNLFVSGLSTEGQELARDTQFDYSGMLKRGVKITDDGRVSVNFKEFKHGNFNISALPGPTTHVWITDCAQTFKIATRSFPKRLQVITLRRNRIRGRIDLSTLPDRLANANFKNNCLKGPICLIRLPPALRSLDLRENPINQHTVYYDTIPRHVFSIETWRQVKEFRAIYPENKVRQTGIFKGVKKENIF